jgi:tRNA(Ile)-lysidine synthase
MFNKVRKNIAIHHLLDRGEHILAAVSGGPDSVALLRVLKMLQNDYALHIDVAHLHHGLRGEEADKEEEFVRLLSRKMNLQLFTKKVNIRELQKKAGKSLEEVAREERYRFLYQMAEEHGAVKIATGHHRDDQAETFLINLLRGSGLEGLKGIAPIRDGRLIRPLLYVGRDEILEFLQRERLSYMTDSSNSDSSFLRNRIRNQLIPELKNRYNPQMTAGLARTAEIIRIEDDYMQAVVRRLLILWEIDVIDREVIVPLAEFSRQHEAIQARIVKFLLEEMTPFKKGISYRHIESVMDVCRKSDIRLRRLNLPFGIVVEKQPSTLVVRKKSEIAPQGTDLNDEKDVFEIQVEIPGIIHLNERNIQLEFIDKPSITEIISHPGTAFLDYERIEPPLFLRNIRPGDKIDLLGLGGVKKLKKIFIDKKIPHRLRKSIPLLADSRSVIWIAGDRISQRVCVTEKTRKVLKVELF